MSATPFLLGLAFLLAAPLLAAPAAAKDTLVVGMSQFPPDMHPNITETIAKRTLLYPGLRRLTGYDRQGAVVCRLCTEVPTLANGGARRIAQADGSEGLAVTFTLLDGLTWGDGVPVTAADAAFGAEVYQAFSHDPGLAGVDVLDDRRFVVRQTRPRYDYNRPPFWLLPAHVEGPLFHAAADPLDYGKRSAYNRQPTLPGLWLGPYVVTAFRPNELMTVEPNPHWHGHPPALRRVTFRYIENTAAIEANLLAGDIDMPSVEQGLNLDQAIALARRRPDRFDVVYEPALSVEHLALRLDNPALADRRVRQALLMAIDRRTLMAKLYEDKEPVAESFVSPDDFGYDPEARRWPFDPDRARAQLAAAGFLPGPGGIRVHADGRRLSFDIVTTAGNRARELIEQVLQTELGEVGVELAIRNEPARTLFGQTYRTRSFTGMVLSARVPEPEEVPERFLHSRYIPGRANNYVGQNYAGFSNAGMDAAIDAALGELDPDRRRADWRRIQAIFAEELPVLPLHFITTAAVTPKWLVGVAPARRSATSTDWIEDWAPR